MSLIDFTVSTVEFIYNTIEFIYNTIMFLVSVILGILGMIVNAIKMVGFIKGNYSFVSKLESLSSELNNGNYGNAVTGVVGVVSEKLGEVISGVPIPKIDGVSNFLAGSYNNHLVKIAINDPITVSDGTYFLMKYFSEVILVEVGRFAEIDAFSLDADRAEELILANYEFIGSVARFNSTI